MTEISGSLEQTFNHSEGSNFPEWLDHGKSGRLSYGKWAWGDVVRRARDLEDSGRLEPSEFGSYVYSGLLRSGESGFSNPSLDPNRDDLFFPLERLPNTTEWVNSITVVGQSLINEGGIYRERGEAIMRLANKKFLEIQEEAGRQETVGGSEQQIPEHLGELLLH